MPDARYETHSRTPSPPSQGVYSRSPSPSSPPPSRRRRSRSSASQGHQRAGALSPDDDDKAMAKSQAIKGTLLFLGAVGAATYAAHKFWPKGITYGGPEEWEIEKEVKKERKEQQEVRPQRQESSYDRRDERAARYPRDSRSGASYEDPAEPRRQRYIENASRMDDGRGRRFEVEEVRVVPRPRPYLEDARDMIPATRRGRPRSAYGCIEDDPRAMGYLVPEPEYQPRTTVTIGRPHSAYGYVEDDARPMAYASRETSGQFRNLNGDRPSQPRADTGRSMAYLDPLDSEVRINNQRPRRYVEDPEPSRYERRKSGKVDLGEIHSSVLESRSSRAGRSDNGDGQSTVDGRSSRARASDDDGRSSRNRWGEEDRWSSSRISSRGGVREGELYYDENEGR